MNMSCKITALKAHNYYEEKEVNEEETKTLQDLSIYELAGQYFEVWLSKNKEGFVLELEADDRTKFEERGLSDYAAEALANFCKQYLRSYERVTK